MKFEANCETGITVVENFNHGTEIYSDSSLLTMQDFIGKLGTQFAGTIGFDADRDDVLALVDAGYIKLSDLPTCPCCCHKLGGWSNSASAENGKKGGRPRKDGMNIHTYQTIMHISFDDNKLIELDFDGVYDVYGDKEEYATAEEAESAFDADYLEELLEKAHESGVELTQDQVDQIMRRMVQWRDRIGDYF